MDDAIFQPPDVRLEGGWQLWFDPAHGVRGAIREFRNGSRLEVTQTRNDISSAITYSLRCIVPSWQESRSVEATNEPLISLALRYNASYRNIIAHVKLDSPNSTEIIKGTTCTWSFDQDDANGRVPPSGVLEFFAEVADKYLMPPERITVSRDAVTETHYQRPQFGNPAPAKAT